MRPRDERRAEAIEALRDVLDEMTGPNVMTVRLDHQRAIRHAIKVMVEDQRSAARRDAEAQMGNVLLNALTNTALKTEWWKENKTCA